MSENAIGGYFELELPPPRALPFPQAHRYQSARSAFLALLRVGKPRRVWMPRYLCDSMYAALREAGVEAVPYAIDEGFEVATAIDLQAADWLYYVDYFGVCGDVVARLLTRFNPGQVVLDHCQAFFAPPRPCLAVIYSPRKFFGVPDGGLVVTDLPLEAPAVQDQLSRQRVEAQLERLAVSPESGYQSYVRSEASLADLEPRRMSLLTGRILATVDFASVRERRNRNFRYLHERLGHLNRLALDPARIDGPLCYPLLVDAEGLRAALIAQRVFVATYWPDVLEQADAGSTEARLVRQLLPLPCDQRYDESDMARIVALCTQFVNR
ncbi:hypothetical protein LK540_13435 [Massilia sp. IC2-278]|uniref:hypothetical protein n=1 Tax=Massilia sp. IC2-278 TaxID=2887200 RepID=UPI001E2E6BF4|nr:hypothetical protein [Massilia sp. IC2-278]MCC2961426.1 hypothetical protein [Massilia sp. IC2-278]